jgi:hypothetical protein
MNPDTITKEIAMPEVPAKSKKARKPSKPIKVVAATEAVPSTSQETPSPPIGTAGGVPAVVKIDLSLLGQSVALADLADAKGMTPQALTEFPDHLAEAGLPAVISHAVIRRAHELYRNAIDAMLWRLDSRTVKEVAAMPELNLTSAQIEAVTGKISRQEVVQFQKREEKRAKASPTIDELQAVASGETKPEPKLIRVASATSGPRVGIFGYPATAVVRWMGAKGIGFNDCVAILKAQGCDNLSESTIKIQLRAGAKADASRGEPANLTEEQSTKLLQGVTIS